MVAEPVQATLGLLHSTYESVFEFVHSHAEKLPDPKSIWEASPMAYFGVQHVAPIPATSESFLEQLSRRLKNHKYELSCILATGLGIAGLVYWQKSQILRTGSHRRRRRAPRLSNGARKDVVLVVGSPTEPLTRLLAIDFERRGFIVFLTILDEKDSKYIKSNTITDDIGFLDLSDFKSNHFQLQKFREHLNTEVVPIQGAAPHLQHLSAVVFTPSLYFPLGPIESTAHVSWEKVMGRFDTYTRLLGPELLDLVREHSSKIISVIPTIVSSLRVPYHGVETVFQNCLKDLFTVLSKELLPQGISVTQIRLGNLNLSNSRALPASKASRAAGIAEAEVRSWDDDIQELYGSHFSRSQVRTNSMNSSFGSQGLRGLHHLLFDLIFDSHSRSSIVYYGTGARTYERISCFLPSSCLQLLS